MSDNIMGALLLSLEEGKRLRGKIQALEMELDRMTKAYRRAVDALGWCREIGKDEVEAYNKVLAIGARSDELHINDMLSRCPVCESPEKWPGMPHHPDCKVKS